MIFAKKSYIVMKENKIHERKMKGVHSGQMEQFTYEILKDIFHTGKKEIKFKALKRNPLDVNAFGNHGKDFFKTLVEAEEKKTLNFKLDFDTITPTNQEMISYNKDNLDQVEKDGIKHFLVFIRN